MSIPKFRVTVSWAMGFLREGYADTLPDARALAQVFANATGKPAVLEEAGQGQAGWLYRALREKDLS